MAVHSYTTRTVVHHEWVMTAPVHYTDVEKAMRAALLARENQGRESGHHVTDLVVYGRDEDLVVSFTQEQR